MTGRRTSSHGWLASREVQRQRAVDREVRRSGVASRPTRKMRGPVICRGRRKSGLRGPAAAVGPGMRRSRADAHAQLRGPVMRRGRRTSGSRGPTARRNGTADAWDAPTVQCRGLVVQQRRSREVSGSPTKLHQSGSHISFGDSAGRRRGAATSPVMLLRETCKVSQGRGCI